MARVRNIASGLLLAAAAAAFIAVAVLPHLGPYRPVTVLSQSMRPTFAAGDLIVVTPERLRDVRVGQIVTYDVPIADHYVETHRVIEVQRRDGHTLIRTKGDANTAPDPWTADLNGSRAWHVRFVVPYAGWGIIGMRTRAFRLAALLVAPALFVLLGLIRIWRPAKPLAV